ncbi:mannose-1-phosphate guanylyltransferase [Thermoanaerobacterium thermosaccharolyticum]|uniref:mannose-1-phosphate guanylyltransferase n=1 Tax=Thermoanaerobacterium thermosaccharolyticum M0795 TaxID=698948 RepID=L0IIF6_THETR|nr:mannose-1-phosphate guanylyltransferase [Thermoanaerobacterium thermosaccharolyticum]AGB18544.1 mannose-1-phosphate guanylyltransferase [Thermoanaerobacterium thermosaccharolyticum M0795]
MITGVIMAGGKGERFWPKSRIKMPKQFLKLYGDRTMIQQTVDRLKRLMPIENIFVVTNIDYAGLISDQIPELPTENILIEPMGKNTAACIGLAAIHTERLDRDSIMVVVPSDHVIKDEETYLGVLKTAIEKAKSGNNLVTIGIKPQHPETGYGYINFKKITNEIINNNPVHKVERFVEKPDYDTAVKYVEIGDYLWNSGMFIWKTSTILNAIKEYMPQLYSALNVIKENFDSDEIEKILYEEYSKLESISIDYGIMEKANNVYVVPGDFGWDDVGSWTSIERLYEKDENGNVIKGNVVSVDTKKCIITGNDKLIATLGIEDVIIVDTEDALLICSKDKAQNVKEVLKELKEKKSEYL